jgi:hypothetical protein
METGADLIAKERKRQIEELGYDSSHDSKYDDNQLASAGAIYALSEDDIIWLDNHTEQDTVGVLWPFGLEHYKPTLEDKIRQLTKAGALIAAQIDYELNKYK